MAAQVQVTPAQTVPAVGSLQAASELLRALSAPHRLAIVLELAAGPRCVHELTASLGASQSLTSQHLRVLRTSGLVVGVRRGKEMAYSLADEHVAHIAQDALAHSSERKSGNGTRGSSDTEDGNGRNGIKSRKGAP